MKRLTLRLFLCGATLALMMTARSLTSSTSQPPLMAPAPSAPGMAAPPLDGAWEGTVKFPVQREKILVRITTADDGIDATMDVPQQDISNLTLHDIRVEHPKVHFEWSEGSSLGVMDGELGSDGRIVGKVSLKGAADTFELVRLAPIWRLVVDLERTRAE